MSKDFEVCHECGQKMYGITSPICIHCGRWTCDGCLELSPQFGEYVCSSCRGEKEEKRE